MTYLSVQFEFNGRVDVGEVQYFCQIGPSEARVTLALVSAFGALDEALHEDSLRTIERRLYTGNLGLHVIDVKAIKLVVGMIPDRDDDTPLVDPTHDYTHLHLGQPYVVVEKLGLQIGTLVYSDDPEMDVDE